MSQKAAVKGASNGGKSRGSTKQGKLSSKSRLTGADLLSKEEGDITPEEVLSLETVTEGRNSDSWEFLRDGSSAGPSDQKGGGVTTKT